MADQVLLKTSTDGLRFFEIEKKMKILEASLIAISLIAAIAIAVLVLNRTNLPPSFTKISFIATLTGVGLVRLSSLITSTYLCGTFKVFRSDPKFLQKYLTFSDFYDQFGWAPFIKKEIDGKDFAVRNAYTETLYQEIRGIEHTDSLISFLGKYSKDLDADFEDSVHHLFFILNAQPERLKTLILNYLHSADFSAAKTVKNYLPDDLLNSIVPEELTAFLTVQKTNEDWIKFKSANSKLFQINK